MFKKNQKTKPLLLNTIACFFIGCLTNANAKSLKGKDELMKYNIENVNVKAQPIISIRSTAKIEAVGEKVGASLNKIELFLKRKGLKPTGAPFTRTFKFENGVLEFESGFPVSQSIPAEGEITSGSLPEGKVAMTLHVGSQETSEHAYKALEVWMEKNKKEPSGAPWEVYLSDPESSDTKQAQMQVYFPIK